MATVSLGPLSKEQLQALLKSTTEKTITGQKQATAKASKQKKAASKRYSIPKVSLLEQTFETHLKAEGIRGFVREYKFCETRKFRFDFAWTDLKIAVEIEGGIYQGGRHTTIKGYTDDCEKYNLSASLGWFVYRFTGEQVKSGEAIDFVKGVLQCQK